MERKEYQRLRFEEGMRIGNIIRELREKLHWNQQKAAKKLGIANVTLSRIEGGVNFPSRETCEKMASLYNVSPNLFEPSPQAVVKEHKYPRNSSQLGIFIRQLRYEKKYTQREVAARANIAPSNLSHYEKGAQPLHQQTVEALAMALGIDKGTLLNLWLPQRSSVDNGVRICRNCRLEKSLEEFVRLSKNPLRYHPICRHCQGKTKLTLSA